MLKNDAFVNYVTAKLAELKFQPTETEYSLFKWTRKLEWCGDEQFLELDTLIHNKNEIKVSARLGLESKSAAIIENEAKLQECGLGSLSPTCYPLTEPMIVVGVPLNWLVKNNNGVRSSWRIASLEGEQDSKEFMSDFVNFAEPFYELTSCNESFQSLMMKLAEFPNKLPSPGPYSQDEIIYTAVVLHVSGDKFSAFNWLNKLRENNLPLSVQHLIRQDPNYLKVLGCRISKVKSYLGYPVD